MLVVVVLKLNFGSFIKFVTKAATFFIIIIRYRLGH